MSRFLQLGDVVLCSFPLGTIWLTAALIVSVIFHYELTAFSVSIFICRASAEEAIQRMQGAMIGQQVVRLSWGRSPTAKQVSPCLNFFLANNNFLINRICDREWNYTIFLKTRLYKLTCSVFVKEHGLKKEKKKRIEIVWVNLLVNISKFK